MQGKVGLATIKKPSLIKTWIVGVLRTGRHSLHKATDQKYRGGSVEIERFAKNRTQWIVAKQPLALYRPASLRGG